MEKDIPFPRQALNKSRIWFPLLLLHAPVPSWAKLSFTFAIPTDFIPSKNSPDYIWAVGSTVPSSASQITIHSQKGVFTNADFVNGPLNAESRASFSLFCMLAVSLIAMI